MFFKFRNKFKGANRTLLLIKKHISMLHFIIQNNELFFKHYFMLDIYDVRVCVCLAWPVTPGLDG